MKISGNTKVYTVIGNPISHSKSPNMHNAAFQKLGINACYVPLAPEYTQVEYICDLIRSSKICGSNVTIPYKEEVMKYVDVLTDEAKLIGSVNTLYSIDNKLFGHNTDGLGFSRSLLIDNGFTIENIAFTAAIYILISLFLLALIRKKVEPVRL